MKSKGKNNLVSWDDHLDEKYGKAGTATRRKYEEEFEAFKIGVLIRETCIREDIGGNLKLT